MTERRSGSDIERGDDADEARKPSDARGEIAANNLEKALLLLTEEERLALIWKKAGFSDREIAKHLSRPPSAVREVHRRAASTIHQSLNARRGTDTSDDDLLLNCPMCGFGWHFAGVWTTAGSSRARYMAAPDRTQWPLPAHRRLRFVARK